MRDQSEEGKIVFVSYAHRDDALRQELDKHLSLLKRQHLIKIWYDQDIDAGTEWEREISTYLNIADIILLLISPDFMASTYCYSIEMERAMERHEKGEARVIPIIVRTVDWRNAPFSKLQVLPTGAKPIQSSQWAYIDEALFNVAEGIRKVIEAPSIPKTLPYSLPSPQNSTLSIREREDKQPSSHLSRMQEKAHQKLTNTEERTLLAYDQALVDEITGSEKASIYQKKIAFLKKLERDEENIEVYNQALADDLYMDDKLTFIREKNTLLKRLGRYEVEQELADYDQALDGEITGSEKFSLYQTKGALLKHLERYEDVVTLYRQALADDLYADDKLTFLKQKMTVLKQLGLYTIEEELADYDQALDGEITGSEKFSLYQRKILFLKGLGRSEDVLATYEQGLADDLYADDKLTFIKQRAKLLKQLGRYKVEDELAAYDQALDEEITGTGRASIYREKIAVLKRLGRNADIVAICDHALVDDLYADDKLAFMKQRSTILNSENS